VDISEIRIYLDLDNVSLDSHKIYEHIPRILSRYGFAPGECWEHFTAVKQRFGAYSPERHYEWLLERRQMVPQSFVTEVYEFIDRGHLLFPDTMPFLLQFSRAEMIILTCGATDHQLRKIRAHKLEAFVADILVPTDNKPAAVIKSAAKSIFFLDDAPREIEAMKRAHPDIFCIQMRTVAIWESQKHTTAADAYAPTLHDAADIILNWIS